MDVLTDQEVRCYYNLSTDERKNLLRELWLGHEDDWPFPQNVLSLFEVHLAHSLLLRDTKLSGNNSFSDCWDEFASFQSDYCRWREDYLTLLECFDYDPQLLYRVFQEIGRPLDRDPDGQVDHYPMTQRFRKGCEILTRALNRYTDGCWEALDHYRSYFPAKLPDAENVRNDKSVVIDNNSLIQLLEQLEPNQEAPVHLRSRSNLNAAVSGHCEDLLDDPGHEAKIIIPVCVLEECQRVADRTANRHVLRVLESMLESGDPFWATFEFEHFSLGILRSYLEVSERCAYLKLADAIVVAHAVSSCLPVISGDAEVRRAKEQYAFLALEE